MVAGGSGAGSAGVPEGPASASASAARAVVELLLRSREFLLGLDRVLGAVEGVFAGLDEVGTRLPDVADRGRGVVQHIAVPVERNDVLLARLAELRRRGRQLCLGLRHGILLRGHLGPRSVDGTAGLGTARKADSREHDTHRSCCRSQP